MQEVRESIEVLEEIGGDFDLVTGLYYSGIQKADNSYERASSKKIKTSLANLTAEEEKTLGRLTNRFIEVLKGKKARDDAVLKQWSVIYAKRIGETPESVYNSLVKQRE